jgi:hypothetical protein
MPQYHGFKFTSTLDWIDVSGPTWPYGAHSGDFAILNNNFGTGVITEATNADFTFDGLWAKGWGSAPESGGFDYVVGFLRGYNNATLVWEVPTSLNGSYEYIGPQAGLIDQLHLSMGNNFLVDDISLNASPAPEPSTLALCGIGACMAGVGARRRRSRGVQAAAA